MTPEEQTKYNNQQLELAKSVPTGSAGAADLATRGYTPEQIGTNPVVASSTGYRSDITNLGGDITKMLGDYGIEKPDQSVFDKQMADYTKSITDQQALEKTRNTEDVAGINKDYGTTKEQLQLSQADALAKAEGRTRIGGFFTQMEAKDIINMQTQHRLELVALESKKTDAVQAANRAYQDGDFKLATQLRDEAKQHEKDIYTRKKDFYDFVTTAANNTRTATKQVRDDAQSRIDFITKGIQDGTVDPKQIDPAQRAQLMKDAGYTFDIFDKIAEKSKEGKVIGSPYHDTVTGAVSLLMQKKDGSYEFKKIGQMSPSSAGSEATLRLKRDQEKATYLTQIQTAFHTPGGTGTGIAGADGKIDPVKYRKAMELVASKYGMLPSDFIKQFPPERYLSAGSLKENPDLVTSSSGASYNEEDINQMAQDWSDGTITPAKVPTSIYGEVSKRKAEIDKAAENSE